MEELKPFKTLEEQITHLKSAHGLIIIDEERAKTELSWINYYRLSAYGISLRDPANKDQYRAGTTFDDIVSLYYFDQVLRTYLALPISDIEVHLRTEVAYCLGKEYGPEGYVCCNNFQQDTNPKTGVLRHQELMNKLHDEMVRQSQAPCVKHHMDKYGGHFPIWAAIELFTFGNVVSLLSIMIPKDQATVAAAFQTDYKHLYSWMLSLLEIRNICAHGNRIYNMPLKQSPRLYKEHAKYGKTNKVFPAILVIKRLMSGQKSWNVLAGALAEYIPEQPSVDIRCLGFPAEWKTVLEIS